MSVLVNASASCQKLENENLSLDDFMEDMRLFIEQERASIAQYKETIDLLKAQMTQRKFEMTRRNFEPWSDRKSTRLNSSHSGESRMPSSA